MKLLAEAASTPSAPPLAPELQALLVVGAEALGVELDPPALEGMALYFQELRRWSERIHLIGKATDEEVVIKHLVDSLSVAPLIPAGAFVLDLGSGAGLPGIPLKIARPDLRILLLEPRSKHFSFLKHMLRTLGGTGATAIAQRADAPGFLHGMQGTLDVVVVRAVSALGEVLRLSAPFLKRGGRVLAMRGSRHAAELEEVLPDLKLFGVVYRERRTLELPRAMGSRAVLVFERRG